MQIDSAFSVVAPIDKVWDTLMDFQRVAGCVPGAQILNKLSDDAYQIGMKVKLGPVSMQYKGQMTVIQRDAAEHRAVIQGRAQETRGQGTAEATVTLHLAEAQGTTRGTVSAELGLSGKAAAMGKSVIGGVTEQMMALFAANLQALLAEPGAEAPSEAERQAPARPDTVAVSAPVSPSAPSSVSSSGNSLDALALVKGMVTGQLNSPGKVLGVLAAVAFCAYRIGRRAGLRSARP